MAVMTGRLRDFFSRERRLAVLKADRETAETALFEMTVRYREEVGDLATKLDEARRDAKYAIEDRDKAERQRDAFAAEVVQLRKERDAIHGTVMSTGLFASDVDLVVAVGTLGQERREARAKAYDATKEMRGAVAENAKLTNLVELLRMRAAKAESAVVAELREANLKLTDQLSELRQANERLEREAAPYGVIA